MVKAATKFAASQREYYQNNKEKFAARKREYYQNNKEKMHASQREYYQKNKEKITARQREYQQKNKEKITARQREYQQKNKEKISEYQQKRYINDPEYAMLRRLRSRMRSAVISAGLDKKCATSKELLGIDTKGLAEWLQSQFTDGMSWDNRSDWHVDHRIPCKAFDITDPEQQRICFWYRNLQPLWSYDNLSKSDKYNEEDKQALIESFNIAFHAPTVPFR